MTIYVAGTFNHLHKGHKALLQRAYDLSRSIQKRDVIIGIMSDQYLREKYPRAKPEHLQSWVERRDAIRNAMGFHPGFKCIMTDTYFPKYASDSDVMVVSEESASNAVRLIAKNNSPIMLSVVPVVEDEEGYKISSRDSLPENERYKSFWDEVFDLGECVLHDPTYGIYVYHYKGKKYTWNDMNENNEITEEDGKPI